MVEVEQTVDCYHKDSEAHKVCLRYRLYRCCRDFLIHSLTVNLLLLTVIREQVTLALKTV